jgi:hypothetical protein
MADLTLRKGYSIKFNMQSMLGRSLSPQHGASSSCGWWDGLQLWRVAANILNNQPETNDKGWFSSLGVGQTTPSRKK